MASNEVVILCYLFVIRPTPCGRLFFLCLNYNTRDPKKQESRHDKKSRLEGANRGKIFYKQLTNRDRRGGPRGKRELGGRELSISILKKIEVGNKPLILKKKRYAVGRNPERHLEQIINL